MPGVPPSDSGGLSPRSVGAYLAHGAVRLSVYVASRSTDHPPMPGVPASDSSGLLPPSVGSGGPGPRHGAVGSSADVASSSTEHPPMPGMPPSDSGGPLPLRRQRRSSAGWPVALPIDDRGKGKQVQQRHRDPVGGWGGADRVNSGDMHNIMVGACGPPSCSVQLLHSQSPSERFSRLAALAYVGFWCLEPDTEGGGGGLPPLLWTP